MKATIGILIIVLVGFLACTAEKVPDEVVEVIPPENETLVNEDLLKAKINTTSLELEDNCTIIAEFLIPEVWELDGRDEKGTFTYGCDPGSCILIAENFWEDGERINPFNIHVKFTRAGQLFKPVEDPNKFTSYSYSRLLETKNWRKYITFKTQPTFKIITKPFEKNVERTNEQFGFYNITDFIAEFEVVDYGIFDCETLE